MPTLLVVYASQTMSFPSCEALTRFLKGSGENPEGKDDRAHYHHTPQEIHARAHTNSTMSYLLIEVCRDSLCQIGNTNGIVDTQILRQLEPVNVLHDTIQDCVHFLYKVPTRELEDEIRSTQSDNVKFCL